MELIYQWWRHKLTEKTPWITQNLRASFVTPRRHLRTHDGKTICYIPLHLRADTAVYNISTTRRNTIFFVCSWPDMTSHRSDFEYVWEWHKPTCRVWTRRTVRRTNVMIAVLSAVLFRRTFQFTDVLEILAARVCGSSKFAKKKIIRKMLDLTANTC